MSRKSYSTKIMNDRNFKRRNKRHFDYQTERFARHRRSDPGYCGRIFGFGPWWLAYRVLLLHLLERLPLHGVVLGHTHPRGSFVLCVWNITIRKYTTCPIFIARSLRISNNSWSVKDYGSPRTYTACPDLISRLMGFVSSSKKHL